MQNSTTGPYGDTRETHTLEMAFAPGRWETWSAGREANTVITRVDGAASTRRSIHAVRGHRAGRP